MNKYQTIEHYLALQLEEEINVTTGGKTNVVTKAQMMVNAAVNRAMKGDITVLKDLLKILKEIPAVPDCKVYTYRMTKEQEEVVKAFLDDDDDEDDVFSSSE
jgi:hypothetical protein